MRNSRAKPATKPQLFYILQKVHKAMEKWQGQNNQRKDQ